MARLSAEKKREEKKEKTAKGQNGLQATKSMCYQLRLNNREHKAGGAGSKVCGLFWVVFFLLVSLLISPQTFSPEDETKKRLSHEVAAIFFIFLCFLSQCFSLDLR